MAKQMKQSVQRVADALRAAGIDAEIKELSDSTRTAEEAAAAIRSSVSRSRSCSYASSDQTSANRS